MAASVDFPQNRLICAPSDQGNVLVERAKILPGAAVSPCAGVIAPPGAAFGAVSAYLVRVTPPASGAAVPGLSWELRARHAGLLVSEIIPGATGSLSKWTSWGAEGSVVHVSGHAALGYELWVRADSGVYTIDCNVAFVYGPPACGPYLVTPGALV